MSTEPAERTLPITKRRRWRFGLRAMFLVVTVVAVFNAICVPVLDEHRWIEIHHQQMATIEQLENHPPPGISLAGWQMQLQFWGAGQRLGRVT